MVARKNPVLILQRQSELVIAALSGRTHASSASLSASYGMPVEQVRRILQSKGVHDDD